MRLLHPKHILQPLHLEFFLIERAHEHEVRQVADNVERVGDAALPHLLPDSINLIFGCSGNHLAGPSIKGISLS